MKKRDEDRLMLGDRYMNVTTIHVLNPSAEIPTPWLFG